MKPIDPLRKVHHELDLIRAGLGEQDCRRKAVYSAEPWRAYLDVVSVMDTLRDLIDWEDDC